MSGGTSISSGPMSSGSLGQSNSTASPSGATQTFTLVPESELRLEIPHLASTSSQSGYGMCSLRLVSGSAELFGAELTIDKAYPLTGTKVAIFTWHGCILEICGKVDIVYTSDETNANVSYVNTHAQLEALRDEAMRSKSAGPRVLLAGSSDSGKTSLGRVLMAYAVKLGRSPLLVDIDVGMNTLSLPGTMTASPITAESISVESFASGSSILGGTAPLVYWYGSTDLTTNPDLYMAQLDKLGQTIHARLTGVDSDDNASGFIVNTPGNIIEGTGYKLLLHAIDALKIDVILILGHDRLYSMLNTHFTQRATDESWTDNNNNADMSQSNKNRNTKPKIIKLPRSGGVVARDDSFRRNLKIQCIKKYFNGEVIKATSNITSNANNSSTAVSMQTASTNNNNTETFVNQYTPDLLEIPIDTLRLYKLSSVSLTKSMLPVSGKQSTDPVQLIPITNISPQLKHAVLAVCHPNSVELFERSKRNEDLYLSGVAGFVAVEKVDLDRGIVSLLSPCSGELPSNTLLCGDIAWME